MNIAIKINGEFIETAHTSTKETSMILGVDVDRQVDSEGYNNGFGISSIKQPEEFEECLNRYNQWALEKTIQWNEIDNEAIHAFFKIKEARGFIEFNEDMTDAKVKEVIFSFL